MPLAIGTKFGPYEILAPLGAGGMGEVYRARDTKLDREVAVKFLPDAFAKDPERLARFEREARVLASLNHPNIAHIYGVEDRALVMELVPGQTLKGPLPLTTALDYAKQIAGALEAAHEKGIVHRDLKPANIMVTSAGVIKVLDFGLAKPAHESTSSADPSVSPTLTLEATRAGVIMGTAAYMSPEQARGKAVDKRADIWAFGVVLYEMLTGKHAFRGETVSDTLASVLKGEPDLSATPVRVRRLLEGCLEKDPEKRLRDIGDAWRLLDETTLPSAPAMKSGRWMWGAGAALALLVIIGWLRIGTPLRDQPTITLSIVPPAGVTLEEVGNLLSSPQISPDGSTVMYEADGRLWLRRLDSPLPRPVPGSEAAGNEPFWSADSTNVVFPVASPRQLLRVRIPDGAPQVVAPYEGNLRGGSWSNSGTVLIASRDLLTSPSAGGEFKAVEMPAILKDGSAIGPQFLPGTEDFVFLFVPSRNRDDAAVYLATLRDRKAVDAVLLLKSQTAARYTPAGGGRIVFVRNDNLYSQKLNQSARKLEGESELLAQGVVSQPAMGINRGDFSVAENGTVVWRPGRTALSQLTVFDRQGTVIGTAGPSGSYQSIALSSDEKQLLVFSSGVAWLVDVGQPGRLELPRDAYWFGWIAGGASLIGRSNDGFMEMSAGGSGEVHELPKGSEGMGRGAWDISSDGKQVMGSSNGTILSMALQRSPTETKPKRMVEKAVEGYGARFSPDGRWFVYEDRASRGLYVQPFPGPGQRRQITAAGTDAAWRMDGKEIVYLLNQSVMSVTVENRGAELSFGAPHKLFSGLRTPPGGNASSRPLGVSRDGSRIFWLQGVEQPESNMIYVKTGAVK